MHVHVTLYTRTCTHTIIIARNFAGQIFSIISIFVYLLSRFELQQFTSVVKVVISSIHYVIFGTYTGEKGHQ